MDKAKQLKDLRDRYIDLGKKIAGYESSLQSLNKRREELVQKCTELGITPEELPMKLAEAEANYDKMIANIEAILDNGVISQVQPTPVIATIEEHIPETQEISYNLDDEAI